MKKILYLITFLSLCACATKSDIEYIRQNDLKQEAKSTSNLNFKNAKEIPKFRNRRYLISPGFLISLSHPSDDKLRGRFRVSFTGKLRLPYNVVINTEGLTLTTLREEVRNSYQKFFQKGVNKVRVSLIRKQYYVEVRGFVKKPGRYLVTRNESIDRVIDQAGGLNGDLTKDFLTAALKQQDLSYSINLNEFFENIEQSKSFAWTGGDTIFVNLLSDEAMSDVVPTVSVLSGVINPGKVLYKDSKDLFYYINKSGGAISNIKYDESYIVRRTDKGLKKIRFDITEMNEIPRIEKNDVIMLYADHRTVWDKILQRASQFTGILSSIAIILLL